MAAFFKQKTNQNKDDIYAQLYMDIMDNGLVRWTQIQLAWITWPWRLCSEPKKIEPEQRRHLCTALHEYYG
jgi:hypothetical protein